jgi:hypothetical protein
MVAHHILWQDAALGEDGVVAASRQFAAREWSKPPCGPLSDHGADGSPSRGLGWRSGGRRRRLRVREAFVGVDDVDPDPVAREGGEAGALVVAVLDHVELEGDVLVDGDGGRGAVDEQGDASGVQPGMTRHVNRMRCSRFSRSDEAFKTASASSV